MFAFTSFALIIQPLTDSQIHYKYSSHTIDPRKESENAKYETVLMLLNS